MDNKQNKVAPTQKPIVQLETPSTQGQPGQTPQPAQKSLEGISGMLIFWIIIFSLHGIGAVVLFFESIAGFGSAGDIASIIFSPLVVVAYLASVTFIVMRKKIAIIASLVAVGLGILNSIVNVISDELFNGMFIETTTQTQSYTAGFVIGAIVGSLTYGGLVALYFFTSKRVKLTLVK